jgi:GPH family glycoside/pentoside/hexuronide:cation symporter
MSTIQAPRSASERTPRIRPFGWRDKVGYMFGDFGNDFTFLLQSSFFLIFYTNVMGISAAHVGTLLFGARILDAFTDVAAGHLIDILAPGKRGRFRPWILRMALPVAIAAILMFAPFLQDGSYGARVAWMTITYVLWGSVCYTLVNIPYGSMASVISNRSGDRSSLSVFRSLGAALANLGISVVLPLVVYVQVDGRSELSSTRMLLAAIACGVAAVICYVLCYANVRERVQTPPKPKEERMGAGQMLGTLVTNRALTGLIAAALLMLLGMMMLLSMIAYTYNEYFNNGQLLSLVNFVSLAPTLLLVPFGTALAKRFGKKEVGVVGLLLGSVAGIVLFVIHTHSPYVFMIGFAVLQLGLAALNVLIWAFITDVIDFQEIRTGERDDATVYATYSWARKLGQALAGGLVGWTLGWIGYRSAADGQAVQQTGTVLDGIYTLSTLVPALLLLAAALCLIFWYPLGRKQVLENVAILEEKHAAQGTQL